MSVFKRNFQIVAPLVAAFFLLLAGVSRTSSANTCQWGDKECGEHASNADGEGSSGLTLYTLQACGVRQDYLTQESSCLAAINECYQKSSACLNSAFDIKIQDFGPGLDKSKNWNVMIAYYTSEKGRNDAIIQCETSKRKQLIEDACKPGCGNGILEAGEYCDGDNNPHGGACANDCNSACGDNVVLTGVEACDGGSDCDAQCRYTGKNTPPGGSIPFPDPSSFCGNGKIELHEDCDHGNLNGQSGETCSDHCKFLPQKAVDFPGMDAAKDECEAQFCTKTAMGTLLCNEKSENCLKEKQDACELKPGLSLTQIGSGVQWVHAGATGKSGGGTSGIVGHGNLNPANGNLSGGCSLSGVENLPSESYGIAGLYLAIGALSLGLSLKKRFFS
ncbi:MAG: hypothetical protein K8R69_05535 [Deltaproteobacteria bacterium]|nr:hypothetical protein [Deltaproteobacteria bacterium]